MSILAEYQRIWGSPGFFTNWDRNIGPAQRSLAAAFKALDLATAHLNPGGRLLEQSRAYLVGHHINSFVVSTREALQRAGLFSKQELDRIMFALRKIHSTWPRGLNDSCRDNHYYLLSLLKIAPALFGVKPLCETELETSADYSVMLNWLKQFWRGELIYSIFDRDESDIPVPATGKVKFECGVLRLFNKSALRETFLQVQNPVLKKRLKQLGLYAALKHNQWQQVLEQYERPKDGDALAGIFYGYPEAAVADFLNDDTPDPGDAFLATGRTISDLTIIHSYFDTHKPEDIAGLLEKGFTREQIDLAKAIAAAQQRAEQDDRFFACRWQPDIAIFYKDAPAHTVQRAIDRFDAALELMAYYLNFVQGLEFSLGEITQQKSSPVFSMLPPGFKGKKTNINILKSLEDYAVPG